MTARRSDDPAARDHADGVGSSAEYWTAQRRHAARPAPLLTDISTDASSDIEGDGVGSGESRPEGTKGDANCGDGLEATERDRDVEDLEG